MDYEQISYERRGAAAVITIERPERMNAIGAQTHRELVDAWTRFIADEDAAVGILTGAGGCGGATTQTAGPASQEDQKKDVDEQKKVEDEERGPQGKSGQGKKPR